MPKPKRIIICSKCKKEKLNYAKGLCNSCYNNQYKMSDEWKKKHAAVMREKYNTDSEYRQKVLDYHKLYYSIPENKEKMRASQKRYYKEHPYIYNKIGRKKFGYLCECGQIDKGVCGGRKKTKHPRAAINKCPQCGKYNKRVKVIFDRITGEILEFCE
jgi:hypothetical protein